jgi:hypothetical protein
MIECGRCGGTQLALDDETGWCAECLYWIAEHWPEEDWPVIQAPETTNIIPLDRYL